MVLETWCEESTAHWVTPIFQRHLHRPTQNRHTPSSSFRCLLISVGVVLCLTKF